MVRYFYECSHVLHTEYRGGRAVSLWESAKGDEVSGYRFSVPRAWYLFAMVWRSFVLFLLLLLLSLTVPAGTRLLGCCCCYFGWSLSNNSGKAENWAAPFRWCAGTTWELEWQLVLLSLCVVQGVGLCGKFWLLGKVDTIFGKGKGKSDWLFYWYNMMHFSFCSDCKWLPRISMGFGVKKVLRREFRGNRRSIKWIK